MHIAEKEDEENLDNDAFDDTVKYGSTESARKPNTMTIAKLYIENDNISPPMNLIKNVRSIVHDN